MLNNTILYASIKLLSVCSSLRERIILNLLLLLFQKYILKIHIYVIRGMFQ